PNHVPRPLNCFFLFKADWLAKRKSLLAEIEQDNRQLNRMASSEWKKLPQEVKQRFKDAARRAKVEHATKYPEYRYTP
ncbi:high mobility group box domain-containing protein, partial [Lactarius indigo]